MLIAVRLFYSDIGGRGPLKVTTWDALGYYMYLPAKYIYHDEKDLRWFPKMDSTYSLSGGEFYQATKHSNGNFVFKYLKGVSQLQLPFFAMAHFYALHSTYPADGFSAPYQYAIALSCLVYVILGLFLLRAILLRYFKDGSIAITLILLTIASNFVQYVSVDAALSHGFIFPLYVLILYATIKWHTKPKLFWAFLIGFVIGLAAISRPTEAVMLFIPLLWNTQSRELRIEKFQFFKSNYIHLIWVAVGVFFAVLPQLFYWHRVTGSWVYDVGSKWDFLNPHFRVLFGGEKGWFVYTPVTILFVLGFFLMKKTEYRNALMTFCMLNIYIIISWHIWRYGGSYSCRALVQSYPIFAFPLACFVEYTIQSKWKILFFLMYVYLIAVNLFQIKQYNENIIHYDSNSFRYYQAIYLNPKPSAFDMSLLDHTEMIQNEDKFQSKILLTSYSSKSLYVQDTIWSSRLNPMAGQTKERWLKFQLTLIPEKNMWASYLKCLVNQDEIKEVKIRLFHPLAKEGKANSYAFYVGLPQKEKSADIYLQIAGNDSFTGVLKSIVVTELWR